MNVLCIGDPHAPFTKSGYLDHCVDTYNRYECDTVVFIGDVLDNHYASFHESDPDGMSASDELDRAIYHLSEWVATFPDAYVTIGNHDRIVARKAFAGGVPSRWLREYSEILDAPGWQFVDEVELDGVLYQHGEGGSAKAVSAREQISIVQGHRHSEAYVWHHVGRRSRLWGMQVGCGIDRKAYAMAYAKAGPKPALACGVVLDDGETPIVSMMPLSNDWGHDAA